MLKAAKVLGLALLIAVVWNAASHAQTDKDPFVMGSDIPPWPMIYEFETVSYSKGTGQLTVKLTISYVPESRLKALCDEFLVTVYPMSGLIYSGPDTIYVPYRTQSPYPIMLDLTLTGAADTSCIVFLWECGEIAFYFGRCYVPTGDTLNTFAAWPNYWSDLAEERTMKHLEPYLQKDYERAKREWEAQQESLKHVGKGSLYIAISPEDSALADSLSEKGKRLLANMRSLERSPLIDEERQNVEIEGRWFVRERGETKFRRIQGKTLEELRAETQHFYGSLEAYPPDSTHDVILDLRDSANYDFAKSLLDSLIPTDSVGFYRAVMNRPTLMKLDQHGIRFWLTECWPEPCRLKRDTTQVPVKGGKGIEQETGGGPLTKERQMILFQEDFEGIWPGQWSVGRVPHSLLWEVLWPAESPHLPNSLY
jgi:hypothetical protein